MTIGAKGSELALTENPAELYRYATDVAGVCKEIVVKSSVKISGRNYVLVEGWMAIATAHGCCASSKLVEKVAGGYRAVAEIRRMKDGVVLCEAEGFVGEDEVTWFGGEREIFVKFPAPGHYKMIPVKKREEYAIRAMAQTRAVSRACRTAFAHVVVMMNADLQTTPAEEIVDIQTQPGEQLPDEKRADAEKKAAAEPMFAGDPAKENLPGDPPDAPIGTKAKPVEVPRDPGNITEAERDAYREGKWRQVVVHFGKTPEEGGNKGRKLGELGEHSIRWYAEEWQPRPYGGAKTITGDDRKLRAALDAYCDEEDLRHKPRHDRSR